MRYIYFMTSQTKYYRDGTVFNFLYISPALNDDIPQGENI